MIGSHPKFSLLRLRPPVRRVLVLDAGSRCLKLLLAESDFGRLRLLREDKLDLQAEGLLAAEELHTHVQEWLQEFGSPPLALVLPQHLSSSQLVELPKAPESEVDKLIADETLKLGGVSESRIIYDFIRVQGVAENRQQFWVTVSQEGDIRDRIGGLGLEHEEICEVTTTDNALIAAFGAAGSGGQRTILVHLGAETTVVVILLAGQGVFASSFQMGGDFFTRSLARLRNCPPETAETLKRQSNLLAGSEAIPEFAAIVDGWVAELKRQLGEWFRQNRGVSADKPAFELVASGGGFNQPGLLEYLQAKADLPFQPWPHSAQPESVSPSKGFEVAFGAALQALEYTPHQVSLLPDDYRAASRKRLVRQRVELASFALVCVCVLLLIIGTWHKLSLIHAKTALLEKVQAGQRAVDENDAFTSTLLSEYENLRPVFAAQQRTVDTLNALALLQHSRSNRDLWYVLLADQQSYFSQPAALLLTNRPARSNLLSSAFELPRSSLLAFRPPAASVSNAAPAKPGYIAELCVPGDAESARRVVSAVVNGLKNQPTFAKVDLLSDDLRRNLAEPKVTVPDRQFVLSLDFAATQFEQATALKKPAVPSRSRHVARGSWPASEPPEAVTRNMP